MTRRHKLDNSVYGERWYKQICICNHIVYHVKLTRYISIDNWSPQLMKVIFGNHCFTWSSPHHWCGRKFVNLPGQLYAISSKSGAPKFYSSDPMHSNPRHNWAISTTCKDWLWKTEFGLQVNGILIWNPCDFILCHISRDWTFCHL